MRNNWRKLLYKRVETISILMRHMNLVQHPDTNKIPCEITVDAWAPDRTTIYVVWVNHSFEIARGTGKEAYEQANRYSEALYFVYQNLVAQKVIEPIDWDNVQRPKLV